MLKLEPNNVAALTNRGFALYHLKKHAEAESTLRKLLTLDKDNALALNNLGAVLEARGKRAEALRLYRRALAINADYDEAKANVERLTAEAVVG